MKSRLQSLSVVLPLLAVCACGDPRQDFVGSYAATGTVTFFDDSGKETDTVDMPLMIVADAFDPERLYLDLDCGLFGTVDEGQDAFSLVSRTCPSYSSSSGSCTFQMTFQSGGGRKSKGAALELDPRGIVKGLCSNGWSGMLHFAFELTVTPRPEPTGGPGAEEMKSTLSTSLHEALERALRTRAR